jgi:8-oxo-dGTP pyrophosphatase MutT (NUDIX family)
MVVSESEFKDILNDALRTVLREASSRDNTRQHSHHKYIDPDKVSLFDDPKVRKGAEWAKYGGNFPVERNGRIYYVSRSMSVSLYTFCKNAQGEWCILANQRGNGAQNARGLWNVPMGYLDYNETAQWAAKRETWEETGVNVPISKIHMMGMNSGPLETDDDIAKRKPIPTEGKQDVAVRFAAVLDGITNNYPVSDANSEPDEVMDIQWIPLSQVKNYNWAYGLGSKILTQAKTSLGDFSNQNGKANDVNTMIALLKREIANNPTASNLFNKILAKLYKRKQQ